MSELVPAEIIIEENQQNVNSAKKNKKMILWGILVVLVLIILYVLFGDESKKYRLLTETRNDLIKNAVPNPLLSETSSNTVGTITSLSSTSSNNPTSSTSASAVRKQLANLFRSYS